MRVAVVSDTHFGDDLCTLVRPGPAGGPAGPGPGYVALRRAVGHVEEHPGAEVVLYETGVGVRSVPIAVSDEGSTVQDLHPA